MTDHVITEVHPEDSATMAAIDRLLEQEGIRRDANLDYTCAMYDGSGAVVATGSCFRNTLRCFAVRSDLQGEGLLNTIVTHLITRQMMEGYTHLFLYTKPSSSRLFASMGFHEIARVEGSVVFMENRKNGFTRYLGQLEETKKDGVSAAIVMNANPFTLGHRYLIEQAASECDNLHLFIISDSLSLMPFSVRRRLVEQGTADIANVIIHDCGPYIISSATFPSYFLRDEADVIESQARLDLAVFRKIAETLNITDRWAGEEPSSNVTAIYNRIMAEELPACGIRLHVIQRCTAGEDDPSPVSASTVRECIKRGDLASLKELVPETTLNYLMSEEAAPVIQKIRGSDDVIHY